MSQVSEVPSSGHGGLLKEPAVPGAAGRGRIVPARGLLRTGLNHTSTLTDGVSKKIP